MRQYILVCFNLILTQSIYGFVCFSEYEVSWCLGEDCSNSYTFSASHYHNKLISFYKTGKRPPLKEAYFITRTPPDFLKQMIEECPAVAALSYALQSHARASLGDDAMSETLKNAAIEIFQHLKPLQQQIMLHSWPINNALMAQDEERHHPRASNVTILLLTVPACGHEVIRPTVQYLGSARVDLATIQASDCLKNLDQALLTLASDGNVEKYDYVWVLTGHEQPGLTSVTLQTAVNGALTFDTFLPLGSARGFMKPNICASGGITGAYIGGAFLVGRNRLDKAKTLIRSFLANKPDNCETDSVVHILFGENTESPLRQDDLRLPVGLRLKHGDEHSRNKWTDVEFGPVVPSRPIELPERGRVY